MLTTLDKISYEICRDFEIQIGKEKYQKLFPTDLEFLKNFSLTIKTIRGHGMMSSWETQLCRIFPIFFNKEKEPLSIQMSLTVMEQIWPPRKVKKGGKIIDDTLKTYQSIYIDFPSGIQLPEMFYENNHEAELRSLFVFKEDGGYKCLLLYQIEGEKQYTFFWWKMNTDHLAPGEVMSMEDFCENLLVLCLSVYDTALHADIKYLPQISRNKLSQTRKDKKLQDVLRKKFSLFKIALLSLSGEKYFKAPGAGHQTGRKLLYEQEVTGYYSWRWVGSGESRHKEYRPTKGYRRGPHVEDPKKRLIKICK